MVLATIRKWFGSGSRPAAPVRRRPAPRPRLERLEDRWVPATLTVDGDGGRQFTTISAAVAAAGPNDTVNVYDAASDYAEQVTIPAGKNGLKLVGFEAGVVLKSPADVTPSTVGGVNLGAALIDVRSTKVEVRGFTLDGSTNADGELYSGVRVVGGGSATIRNNVITGMDTAGDAGYGVAVQVGSSKGTGSAGTAKVQNNTLTDYLGAGVLVDGSGANGDVRGNTITGRGAANGGVAQYGVQVSRGATARVEGNVITGNSAADNSAAVLLFQTSGKKNVVAKNAIDGNEIGIWVFETDGRSEVLNNDVTNSGSTGILVDASDNISVKNNDVSGGTGDGIGVYDSTGVEVRSNESSNNGADGIYVFGGSCNEVKGNEVSCNAENGIATEDSSDNWLWGNETWGNGSNGVEIVGGSGNDIWLSTSHANAFDGILLQDTTGTTVIGNVLGCNGGYGLRLDNADGTFIALNLVQNNGEGSIFISADSQSVVTVANRTDEPIDREEIGAAAVTASWANSVADSDALVAELD